MLRGVRSKLHLPERENDEFVLFGTIYSFCFLHLNVFKVESSGMNLVLNNDFPNNKMKKKNLANFHPTGKREVHLEPKQIKQINY